MPVFAKLSRRFYEVVGEDVAQQLVDWLNEAERELTWRARFRSYNELDQRGRARSGWHYAPVCRTHCVQRKRRHYRIS